ncbi:MAG: sigma-70 family RNA polymerase sigma factor [Deltaproteobacteria bacterium]|nr:sigma-70 family RNA polymerase sigma factor [Deltaproteobacteria bacterium]
MARRIALRKHPPRRPVRLIERVVAGDSAAWKRFVEHYTPFLYAIAWRYARPDADTASELVLVALEGLRRPDAEGRDFYRLRKYLESLQRYRERSRFTTWLALVSKNLFRDWYRQREGRRLLPKEIRGLDEIDQALFSCLFWDGCSETEACGRLCSRWPEIGEEECAQRCERVRQRLSERNLWNLYRDLMRRLPGVPIHPTGSQEPVAVQLPDPHPDSRPDSALQRKQDRAVAGALAEALGRAVEYLPQRTQQVVRLLMLRGMTGAQVQRIMGFGKRQRVYDEMDRARRRIRESLERDGFSGQDLRRAEGWLDSGLEENDPSGPDLGSAAVVNEHRADEEV